jgi:serine/threonine protein kinase
MKPTDPARPQDPNNQRRPKLAPLSKVTKSDKPPIDLQQELSQAGSSTQTVAKFFSQELSNQNVEIESILGKGSQATVYLARYKPTNEKIALKKVFVQDKNELLCLQRELLSLSTCVHPNVLRCFGARVSPEQVLISLEYMDWGTLRYFIENEPKGIPEVVVSIIVWQVLKGLAFLHKEKKTIHRDIKPSNLLLNRQGEVKIADFGIARQVGGTEGQANTFLGTMMYMSPERLNGKEYQMNCDIWALGLVAYECALGRYPGFDDPKKATLLDLRRMFTDNKLTHFPQHFSDKFKSFLACCLQVEFKERAKAADLLEHPFVKQAKKIDQGLFPAWLETVVNKALHMQKKEKGAQQSK